jgi:anaerobic magnesium-protoporphyrin IX monomethyl ester cyclase
MEERNVKTENTMLGFKDSLKDLGKKTRFPSKLDMSNLKLDVGCGSKPTGGLKILFVNVIDLENAVHKRYYPLAFGYLASYCRKNGVEFEPCYAEKLNEDILRTFQPNVVALTSITENYNLACSYAHTVKKFNPKIPVVIGGVHISAVPQSLSPSMDVGVLGEGEKTFMELVKADFEPNDNIKGIVYWESNSLRQTEERPLIEPLDSIPHPDRSLFGFENRPQYIFTSRGCCYRCNFCSSSRFWKKVRFHSPEYVAEEIQQLKEQLQVNNVNIYDDLFIIDAERVKRIRDLVKPFGLTYAVAARANLITDDIVATLKDMGVTAIGIGMESYSQRILDYLGKGNTVEDNQRAVDIIRRHGIHLNCSFIRDVPIETRDDLKKTYEFIKRNNLPYDMYRLMKFPNTPLYDGSTDWDACKVHYYVPIHLKLRRKLLHVYAKIVNPTS